LDEEEDLISVNLGKSRDIELENKIKEKKKVKEEKKVKNCWDFSKNKILPSEENSEIEIDIEEDIDFHKLPFFKPSDYFGEEELFDLSQKRRHTVRVINRTVVYKINRKILMTMMMEESILWPFLQNMALRNEKIK